MATNYARGASVIAAYKTHTQDWDDPTQVGVELTTGDRFEQLVKSWLRPQVGVAENDAAVGNVAAGRFFPVKTTEMVAGEIEANFTWNDQGRHVAAIMGAESAVTVVGGGAFLHEITMAEANEIVGTYGFSERHKMHEFPFVKHSRYAVEFGEKIMSKATIGLIGKKEITDDTGQTTLAEMLTIGSSASGFPTLPAAPDYPIMSTGQAFHVRINATSGSALAAGDRFYPTKVSLNIARSYSEYFTPRNATFQDEPVGDDWVQVTGQLDFATFDDLSTTLKAWAIAATSLKMEIYMEGAVIAGSDKRFWKFQLPAIRLGTDGFPTGGAAGRTPWTVPFTAYTARTAPTGWTSPALTAPLRVYLQDIVSGKHLTNGV